MSSQLVAVKCNHDPSHIFYLPPSQFEFSPEGAVLCKECREIRERNKPGSHWPKRSMLT